MTGPTENKSPNSPKKLLHRVYRSASGRRLFFQAPRLLAKQAQDRGFNRIAYPLARVAHRYAPQDVRSLYLVAKSLEGMDRHSEAERYRAERLKHLLPKFFRNKDYKGLLIIMAEMERTHRSAQFSAGNMIAEQLVTPEGRKLILKHALAARRRFHESAFLSHLITLCQGMQGDYRAANDLLRSEIDLVDTITSDQALNAKRKRILEQSWRVVDLIAREQMDWADEPGAAATFSDPMPADPMPKAPKAKATTGGTSCQSSAQGTVLAKSKTKPKPQNHQTGSVAPEQKIRTKDQSNDQSSDLSDFKEHALQGRMRETYLELCDDEFHAAESLAARLKTIEDMLRTGVRHMPSYTSSYAQARARLQELAPELETLFAADGFADLPRATATVMQLCTVLRLARRLKMEALSARVAQALDHYSDNPDLAAAFWPAPAVLAADPADVALSDKIMARIGDTPPKINRDAQYFFRWAEITRRYKEAHAFYNRLPKGLHRRAGLLYYVNILQREGKLKEARALLAKIHGQSLCNPSGMNPFTNHSLIKRAGELDFLLQTAEIYKSVPQPKRPKGILLIGPRNIDQLRRYPLMVLLEFKRRGWAVVPIVEGFLPKEKTGISAIDLMNGALSPNIRFSPQAEAKMPPVTDFVFEPEMARLQWGDIDLRHSLWEDAAINRRRYNIDWSCPELQKYLGGLADWSRAMARVMQYAKHYQETSKAARPTAFISLFNCRLPDSLFRFYCQQHGDPQRFFYLHTANGYQNYFTNFSTNISQRLVLRNMTQHPHVRSGSFPLPENFETYYKAQTKRLPEIMERFVKVTKVKRSTEGTKARPPEAEEADARIKAWRARGGKIACAFGKVVCDSSVPFDGGPAHTSMKDWINHCIRSVKGSNTMLLIKPHPHELNNQIATFPTEYFNDLLEEPLNEQTLFLGHRWFDMHDMKSRMDLGLIYNGTTAVELGIMGIPSILAGHFAPIDYPVGHATPKDRAHFEAMLRGEAPVEVVPDLKERCAVWLDYMANEDFTQPYRYHSRPVTNKVLYPPIWFDEDLANNRRKKDPAVQELIGRALGMRREPGGQALTR